MWSKFNIERIKSNELNQTDDWVVAVRLVTLMILASLAFSMADFIPKISPFIYGLILSIGMTWTSRKFCVAINEYNPTTVLEAKRANEQIKLLANFASAIAVATFAVLALSNLIDKGSVKADISTFCLIMLGAWFIHSGGRNILGLIKDECSDAYPPVVSVPRDKPVPSS